MGAQPPVPYIARIDEAGLHLCCPVLRMDRPTVFDGDGYCLMKRGPIESSDDAEGGGLTTREKLFRCVQELTEAVPDTQLEEISHLDTEDTARQKVMVSVRFESAMYAVQKRFGEAVMKEVLDAAKNPAQPHDTLSNTEAMQRLTEKLKASGVLAEEQAPTTPATASPSATPSSAEVAGATASTNVAAERTVDAGTGDTGAAETQSGSGIVATAGVLSVAAALTTAFVLWRRHRR